MGSEYFINSQELEDKIRQLLPSQGGAGAGFDLSASTQIIPIIDLTESAQGSNLREDLQTSVSFNSATVFNVANTTTTVITNTGYWRLIGTIGMFKGGSKSEAQIILNDGATDKIVYGLTLDTGGTQYNSTSAVPFDLTFFLQAGDSLKILATTDADVIGSARQVATIDGVLVDPS